MVTTRHLLPVLAAGLLVLAACSSADDSPPTEAAPSTAATTAPASTAPPTTEPPPTTEAPPTTPVATDPPSATAPPMTAPPSTAPPTTAPAEPFVPIGLGPFEVGGSTITVGEGTDRPLTVEVWYPLAEGTGTGLDPHRYTLVPEAYYDSPVALAATPDLIADGAFPLVVYSHGSSGLRYIHSSYTEAVASHGHVVVAADHTGNTTLDLVLGTTAEFDEIAYRRPEDVARLVDAFTGAIDDAGATPWVDAVDAERIVVSGHSFGGFTAVASVTGFANEVGEIAADPRVDGIITFAPATSEPLLSDETIAMIDVPMLILAGTSDDSTPIEPNVTRMWDLNDNSPAYRGDLVDAEHQTFTDLCAYLDLLPELPAVPAFVTDTIADFVGDACSPGAMDAERAAELTNTYSVSFLDEVLDTGESIELAPPDDVVFFAR